MLCTIRMDQQCHLWSQKQLHLSLLCLRSNCRLDAAGRGWWASWGVSRCRGCRQVWRGGGVARTLPTALIPIVLLINNVVWEDKNNWVFNCYIVSNCPHHLNPLDIQVFKSCDIIFFIIITSMTDSCGKHQAVSLFGLFLRGCLRCWTTEEDLDALWL